MVMFIVFPFSLSSCFLTLMTPVSFSIAKCSKYSSGDTERGLSKLENNAHQNNILNEYEISRHLSGLRKINK